MYEIYLEYLDLVIQAKDKLCDIIEKYKKNNYEYVQVRNFESVNEKRKIIQYIIRRTEFSKTKYITLYTMPMTRTLLFLPYNVNEEKFEYEYYETFLETEYEDITYEEMINILQGIISFLEYIIEYNKQFYNNLTTVETTEIEPVKPKGNPYSCESWKDRKHKFKGGKRK